jgi:serralysin
MTVAGPWGAGPSETNFYSAALSSTSAMPTDHMWGDAQIINRVPASTNAATGTVVTGADTFVFAPGNGNDDINDFRQSDHDKIDVSAYGFHNIADMTITADGQGNTKIAFDANDFVTLVGISDPHSLHASEFIFIA